MSMVNVASMQNASREIVSLLSAKACRWHAQYFIAVDV